MAISFNGIPTTVRTPGVHAEIDNSRALQGLAANPHKVLIMGQSLASGGTVADHTLMAITSDNLADGYFGSGSILARMCNVFKDNNPNTELYAISLSTGAGVQASGAVDFSLALAADTVSGAGTYYLMINGIEYQVPIYSGDVAGSIVDAAVALINADSQAAVEADAGASTGRLSIQAICSGTLGNQINIRANYYTGQSLATAVFSTAPTISLMNTGSVDPDLGDEWGIIENERFNYIIQPYTDAANLTEIETELEDRFGPLVNQQGHGFTVARVSALASATALGNSRNCEFNTIMAQYDSPTDPCEWAAALGAKAAFHLNEDPARPLHYLKLKGILPPPTENRWTRAERDILLYDGIATYKVDSGGNVLIERCITTYQKDANDVLDASYLDVTTMATLGEIRDQWLTRMSLRFLSPRCKLADDGFPVQPGSYVVTPSVVKQETIALFTALRDRGLIENLDDFIENLVVERDATDVNRCNVLLPPNLINQFRVLAGKIQFIL